MRVQPRQGVLTPVDAGFWWQLWRDPNHLLLAAPWPVFLAMVAAAYGLVNLLFAGLYLLDASGIGGVAGGGPARFADAFFFSVQTLGSIGYGVLHPVSLTVNLLVSAESLLALLFIALTTGLAFARFSHTVARIRFSTMATVHPYDGVPTLMFRLANERHNTIVEAKLKLFLALDEYSREGLRMRRLIPLTLRRSEGIVFMLVWTAMHPIDPHSPLHGLGPQDLVAARAELLVAFSGIDETLERPIHARHNYPAAQIVFGQRFVDMVEDEGSGHILHFELLDHIEPIEPAQPSSRQARP
ncbi:MAG: potassium transporter [Cyanobium sp. CACIAM 14]|nr:MAG: potassium transporter [Cyanobium sp. CACIAM 14]